MINMSSMTTMTTLTMTLTTMRILTITTTMTTTTTTTIVDSTIITELNPLKLKQKHPQLLELLQNLEKKADLMRGKRRKNLLFMRHLHGIIYN